MKEGHITNDDFISRFLEGDSHIIDRIYKTNFKYVARYVTARDGSLQDAEDVFHNALLVLYVKLKEGRLEIKSFDNYLFTICKNLWKRENSKKEVTNLSVVSLVSRELDLSAFYLEHAQWELYKEKFELLSKPCKLILKMIFDGKSYETIVKAFSYASQTVARQRVFKCKKRLTQIIKQDPRFVNLK